MPKPTFDNLPAEKRASLMALALQEFAEHDFATASVSRLVDRAGIAKGSLYQYFDDKADLFVYLVAQAEATLLGALQTLGGRGDPLDDGFLQRLRGQMSATIQAALAHPREARLIQRARQAPPEVRQRLDRHDARLRIDHMRSLLVEAQASGELAGDYDPELVAHLLAAIMSGLGPVVMARLGFDPERDSDVPSERLDPVILEPIFDEVLRFISHGLRPASALV